VIIGLHPTRTLTLRDAPARGLTLDEQLAHILRDLDDEVTVAHQEVARAVLASLERTDAVCRDLEARDDEVDLPIEFSAFVLILASSMFRSMLDMFSPEGEVMR